MWDTVLTLLHPTGRGPLSHVANRATWRVVRAFTLRVLRGRRLSFAGPLSVTTNVASWPFLLWVGFALIYLPHLDAFRFDPGAEMGGNGMLKALYLSGMALTTMGASDVVITSDVMRMVSIAEAATGFGAFSAAIAFVLSVYPLLTDLRDTGLRLADLGTLELHGAGRLIREAGADEMPSLVRELTQSHEQLKRFPVLYYFESGSREASLSALVRGSALLLLAVRCVPTDVFPQRGVYADTMEHILDRLVGDLSADFVGGRLEGGASGSVTDEEAASYDISALCARLNSDAGLPVPEVSGHRELSALLARAESVLSAVAHEHGFRHKPLFPQED